MLDRRFYIYLLFRPNGRPCYLGKGRGERWTKHERRGTHNLHLSRIIKNAKAPLPKVIIRDGLTEEEAFVLEKIFIKAIGREKDGGPLVNKTDGGEGVSGHVHSAETRKKLSEALKGRPGWNKGVPVTEDARVKMRAAKIGKRQKREHVAKRNATNTGRKRTPEMCANITAGKLGKKATEETKAILKAANRSRDPEVRARIKEATRLAMLRPEVQAKMQAAWERQRNPKG